MEMMNINPDNDETMKRLAELLLDSATSQHQENYIALVGDGKMYVHHI